MQASVKGDLLKCMKLYFAYLINLKPWTVYFAYLVNPKP